MVSSPTIKAQSTIGCPLGESAIGLYDPRPTITDYRQLERPALSADVPRRIASAAPAWRRGAGGGQRLYRRVGGAGAPALHGYQDYRAAREPGLRRRCQRRA